MTADEKVEVGEREQTSEYDCVHAILSAEDPSSTMIQNFKHVQRPGTRKSV